MAVRVTVVMIGSGVWVAGGIAGFEETEAEKISRVVTVKLPREVPVPDGVTTEMGPELAPVGTAAVNWVALITVGTVAVPLNLTAVAPLKFVPVTMTVVPTGPVVGLKSVTVGAGGVTVSVAPALVIDPALFVTVTS
jgi:hypothetical protein